MNVIVIVADSLRYDHLTVHGESPAETPHLEAFARESTVFDNCYAEGVPTIPARTAMWLGRFTIPFRGWEPLAQEDVPIAEWLWDKGFRSALITDVYHMHKPGWNLARGFDEVYFVRGQEYDPWVVNPTVDVSEALARHFKPSPAPAEYVAHWRANLEQYLRNVSVRKGEEDYFVAQVVNAAIHWLEAHAGEERLFLWVDCFDPHEPWDPPEDLKHKYAPNWTGIDLIDPIPEVVAGYLEPEEMDYVRRMYAAEVEFVDGWIGKLLEAAEALGYFDNSLIVFTSDHGEPLDDHGIVRKCRPWNYEELAHVPLIVRLPGGEGGGRRVNAFVQHPDFAPTICQFLAIDTPPGTTGTSFWPLITGEAEAIRDFAVTGHCGASWTIRTDDWSFHLLLREMPKAPAWVEGRELGKAALFGEPRELYDRKGDRAEQHNLIGEHGEVADALELKLRRFMASLRWEKAR